MKCLGLELLEQGSFPRAQREDTCDPSPISKTQQLETSQPEEETVASWEPDASLQQGLGREQGFLPRHSDTGTILV